MMCKLGDKNFKENEREIERDMEKEMIQVSKIRELIKERNRERGQTSRMQRKPPAAKRRKPDDKIYQESQEDNLKRQEYSGQEKRKAETENEPEPTKKRRPNMDVRELFLPKVDRNTSREQDSQEQSQ